MSAAEYAEWFERRLQQRRARRRWILVAKYAGLEFPVNFHNVNWRYTFWPEKLEILWPLKYHRVNLKGDATRLFGLQARYYCWLLNRRQKLYTFRVDQALDIIVKK